MYGITRLRKGVAVAAKVYCLAGLLPLDDAPMYFPCVETPSGTFADIHIFPGDERDWVLLLDATAAEMQCRLLQQRANDFSLLQERQAKAFSRDVSADTSMAPGQSLPGAVTNASLLANLFAALEQKLLLIAFPKSAYEEKHALIQRARENNLEYYRFDKEIQKKWICPLPFCYNKIAKLCERQGSLTQVDSGFLDLAGVVDRPDFDKGIEFCPQFYSFACSLMLSESLLPRALQRMQQMLRSTGVYALQLYSLQSHLAPRRLPLGVGFATTTRAISLRGPRETEHADASALFRLPEHKHSPFSLSHLIRRFFFYFTYFSLIISSYRQVAIAGHAAGMTGSSHSEPISRGAAPTALTCRPCVTPQLPTGRWP